MILRNPREEVNGLPIEDVFLAIDERSGNTLGKCEIMDGENAVLFPQRPHQVLLNLSGNADTFDILLGASLARARTLCAQSSEPARIFTSCAPDDDILLSILRDHGFKDNDGIVRMRARLPLNVNVTAPAGCVVVCDRLEDEKEQKYFLERYNKLYNTLNDQKWLVGFMRKENFLRTMTVAPTGMAGEVVSWLEGDEGVIGYLQTARRWRHMGVARYMVSLAAQSVSALGIDTMRADTRARTPYILKTMEKCGFIQDMLVMRYPGIDL